MNKGIKGQLEIVIDQSMTAKQMGSGTLDVFSTPAMIQLIEKTAFLSVQNHLEQGQTTVGIKVNITHESSSPVGMKIVCKTELVNVDGKRLDFVAEVFDEKGLIGKGEHSRFIVESERFLEKTEQKLK